VKLVSPWLSTTSRLTRSTLCLRASPDITNDWMWGATSSGSPRTYPSSLFEPDAADFTTYCPRKSSTGAESGTFSSSDAGLASVGATDPAAGAAGQPNNRNLRTADLQSLTDARRGICCGQSKVSMIVVIYIYIYIHIYIHTYPSADMT
jgi:hypothetical protein